jgi:S1-C subfamily serine protease
LEQDSQSFIGTRRVEGFRLVEIDGTAVIESYRRLADIVSRRCGQNVAALFAEPRITRGNGAAPARIDWYAQFQGIARPLSELDASSAATVRRALEGRLAALKPLAFDAEAGPLIAAALNIATPESIVSVGGDPVLTDWSMLPLSTQLDERGRARHFSATLGPFLGDFPLPPLSRADWAARFAGTRAAAATPPARNTAAPAELLAATGAPPPRHGLRGLLAPLVATVGAAVVFGLAMTPGVLVFPEDQLRTPEADRMVAIAKGVTSQLETRRRQLEEAMAQDCTTLLLRQSTGTLLLPPRPSDIHVQIAPSARDAPNASSRNVDLPARVDAGTVLVIAEQTFGSGFFVTNDTIVTNRHVVGDAPTVVVTNKAIGTVEAKVIARGPPRTGDSLNFEDFAVLRVPSQTAANPFRLAALPQRLQHVLAVGYPGMAMAMDAAFDRLRRSDKAASVALSPVITEGQVNHLQPQGTTAVTLVIHGADISLGSSGGPLVDLCGRVVAINTFGLVDNAVMWRYALGSDGLRRVLQSAGVTPQFDSAGCIPQIVAAVPPVEPSKGVAPLPEPAKAAPGEKRN